MSTDDTPSKPRGGAAAKLFFGGGLFIAGAAAGGFGAAIGTARLGGATAHEAPAAATAPVEYVEIDNAFTSNLVDTGRYLQVRLSVSTTGGPPVVAAIARHKPALISTVLAVLGESAELDVADRPAKDKLRARLLIAINEVLKARGEPNGINEVFFTSLVVQ